MTTQSKQEKALQQQQIAEENNLGDSIISYKYRVAADIANEVLRKVIDVTTPGRRVYEVCAYGDQLILDYTSKVFKRPDIEKGIAYPTCINIGSCVQNFSPLPEDQTYLHHGDVVKIELGVHVDGYIALASHTIVLNSNPDKPIVGRAADAICAAYFGLEVALRVMKPGARVSEVTSALAKVASAFRCTTIETIPAGHLVRRFVLEAEKTIPSRVKNNQSHTAQPPTPATSTASGPNDGVQPAPANNSNQPQHSSTVGITNSGPTQQHAQSESVPNPPAAPAAAPTTPSNDPTFEPNEVWSLNVVMTTSDALQLQQSPVANPPAKVNHAAAPVTTTVSITTTDHRTTIYRRNTSKQYNLKLKTSRMAFNEIVRRFGSFPFTISALEDKRTRLGVTECVSHDLLHSHPVLFDTSQPLVTSSSTSALNSKDAHTHTPPHPVVAQFRCSVIIPPRSQGKTASSLQPVRITYVPLLPYVHSEYSITGDPELGPLLGGKVKTVANRKVDAPIPAIAAAVTGSTGSQQGNGLAARRENGRVTSSDGPRAMSPAAPVGTAGMGKGGLVGKEGAVRKKKASGSDVEGQRKRAEVA
ncbi:Proliferation-associated protein 2G4 [Gonapodya sp. JEL0774]|nr:Proliferation-associated protein 2G4 [Gonapodya sp. JEL0774]